MRTTIWLIMMEFVSIGEHYLGNTIELTTGPLLLFAVSMILCIGQDVKQLVK